ncbi:hypothetical protein AHAS_Ahas16G0194900 [Arachis hypogaea]
MVHPYRPTSESLTTYPECYGTRTNCEQFTFSRLGLRSCLSCRSLLQYVPNGKYLRLPAATTSLPTTPVEDNPSLTPQAPTTDELLQQIIKRLDRQEHKAKLRDRRNNRRFKHLRELLRGDCKDSDTLESTSFTSTGSHDGPDCGDTATSPLLFLTDSTENGAKP